MKNLFQLVDIDNESVGLYTSETKDGQDLNDLCCEHMDNALEAMEDITLEEHLEQNGFERVYTEIVYDY